MNAKAKLYLMVAGAAVFGGIGASATRDYIAPRYYWYDVPQTDSIRALLNAHPGARLRLEERTKNHIWVGVLRPDSAARVAGSFEVEESFPCPPICP